MEVAKIVKYIVSEANANEVLEMEIWIAESEENKAIFKALEKTWSTSKSLKPQYFDVAEGWEKFKVNSIDKKPKVLIFKTVYWKYMAAAVLLIGIFFGYNYFQKQQSFNATSFVNQSDSIQSIALNDGSKISLLKGTLTQNKNWSNKNRKVNLNGIAFFKVNSTAKSKFTIQAGNCEVVVLGTEFLVTETDSFVKVNLMNGNVAFKTPKEELLLKAGQSAIYDVSNNKVYLSENTPNAFANIDKKLVFENVKLSDAIVDIEQFYGVKIVLDNNEVGNQKINTKFEHESLQNVLQILSVTLGVQVSEKDGFILISKQ